MGELHATAGQMAVIYWLMTLDAPIIHAIRELAGKNDEAIRGMLIETYSDSYYRTFHAMEQDIKEPLTVSILSAQEVNEKVDEPIDGAQLSDRITRNAALAYQGIRDTVSQGLAQGESYQEIAERLQREMEIDANRALLIARTQGHQAQQAGRLDSLLEAEEQGVEMVKVWDATLDKRTRPAHRTLDGLTIGMKEMFVSPAGGRGPAPGQMKNPADDINCRCILRGELLGFGPTERRIRNDDGTTSVIPYQTYTEWAKSKGIE